LAILPIIRMRQSTRLIVNTLSMFGRMALTVGISLVITRLLLQTLGKVDFGLVLALGATGAMLQFFTTALTTSVQRQLAQEIARKDAAAIGRAFSTGWLVFTGLGAVLWLIGFALTPLVMQVLTIPPERADAAWWVYQISLLNLVLVVTATPYQAMIVAHQHLTVQSIVDVFNSLSRLAAVLLLFVVPWDRMVAFVAMQLAGYAVVRWSLNLYCLWRYEGSWPRPRSFDRRQFREIVGIGGWTLVAQLSWRFRMQGGIILLNVFFGPAVNGAYGIATQIVGYGLTLANAIRMAVLPAIVGAHARGNRQNVQRLALTTGKYMVLLMSLAFVPLCFEAAQALRFWLPEVPDHTLILTRLAVVWLLVGVFPSGYLLANTATGNLGWYTRRMLLWSILTLVAAGVGFYFGLEPWFLPTMAAAGAALMMIIAATGIGPEIGLPPSRWFFESLLPTLGVLAPATIVAGVVHWTMAESVWRFLAVTAAFGMVAAPLIWWVALAGWERERFLGFASAALARFQQTRHVRPPSAL
jgi:O-antigen/teichoic acid export membrane protein